MPDERPDGWGCCYMCGADCEEADYNPRTRQSLCQRCDAYEPPANGEDFRGGEARAYEAEQQIERQSVK